MKLNDYDRDIMKLIGRSPDRGDGWRTVSDKCWPLIQKFGTPELIEIDEPAKRVRLTEAGNNVLEFAI